MYPNNTIILVSNGGRRKVLANISTKIYLEHQTNNIRATILYTLIGVIAVMLLGWLQMALKMQRVGNTKKGCAMSFIFSS